MDRLALYLAAMFMVTALGWPRAERSRLAAGVAAAVCLASASLHVGVALDALLEPRVAAREPFPAWFGVGAAVVVLVVPAVFTTSHAWLFCRAVARLVDRRDAAARPRPPYGDAWRGLGAAMGAGVALAVAVAMFAWALPVDERETPRRSPLSTPVVQRLTDA